jgi:hypothetical protein
VAQGLKRFDERLKIRLGFAPEVLGPTFSASCESRILKLGLATWEFALVQPASG